MSAVHVERQYSESSTTTPESAEAKCFCFHCFGYRRPEPERKGWNVSPWQHASSQENAGLLNKGSGGGSDVALCVSEPKKSQNWQWVSLENPKTCKLTSLIQALHLEFHKYFFIFVLYHQTVLWLYKTIFGFFSRFILSIFSKNSRDDCAVKYKEYKLQKITKLKHFHKSNVSQ